MDVEKFGELVGVSVANGAAVTPEQVIEVLADEELLQAIHERGLVDEATGAIATKNALGSSPDNGPILVTHRTEADRRIAQSWLGDTTEQSTKPNSYGSCGSCGGCGDDLQSM